jgi:hypothetical protein
LSGQHRGPDHDRGNSAAHLLLYFHETEIGRGGTAYVRTAFSGCQPCDTLGDDTAEPATVPSFAGTTVDGLTVTSNSSEVAAVPTGSA